jgi:hypothetical protein
MTYNGLSALAQCGFVCGIPKDAHQTEEHPWEPLHHDSDRLAHDFAMKYGLAALPDRPAPMTYAEAVHLEKRLATFLRAALATARVATCSAESDQQVSATKEAGG